MSIGRAIGWLARQDPDAVALRCGSEVLTRAELDARSSLLAARWIEEGVRPDDLVCIGLANGIDVVVANVAVWKTGATPQPLSPRLPAAERKAVLALGRPRLVVDGPLPRLSGPPPDLPDLAASCWKAPTSSGSTGAPKIVAAAASAHVDPEGRVAPFVPRAAVQLVAGPLFHAAPYVYAMRGLMTGHELVVMPRFDAGEWLRLVSTHRVSWGMLVPTTMGRIWRHPDRESGDVSSLESILHLGARCAPWLKRAWIDWLGPDRVQELYAGTESQGLATISGREWLTHPGSVGRAVPGSRFRVVRNDDNGLDDGLHDCAPAEVGEVLMRRDEATYSYVGAVADVRDGWHTLGDNGWLDIEGYLYIADRIDDVVVSGGVNVVPADVEAVLEEHPAVRCAVVVGRPDDDLGQRVHAVVQREDIAPDVGVDELDGWCRTRLDPEKRPRSWEFVDEPLRDDTGKVRRSRWATIRTPDPT